MSNFTKKIVTTVGVSALFLIIAIFGFFGAKELIFGVQIKNVSIEDGATLKDSVVNITGNAKHATKLVLNGREISIDEKGNFNETIVLLLGYNVVNIKAQDKFGLTDEKNYKLMHI